MSVASCLGTGSLGKLIVRKSSRGYRAGRQPEAQTLLWSPPKRLNVLPQQPPHLLHQALAFRELLQKNILLVECVCLLSVAVVNSMAKTTRGRQGLIKFPITVYPGGKSMQELQGRSLQAGAEAEAMKGYCLRLALV